jgi:hypothetical protein
MEQGVALVEPHLDFGLGGRDRKVRRPDACHLRGTFTGAFIECLAELGMPDEVPFFGSFRGRLTLLRGGGRDEQATHTQ